MVPTAESAQSRAVCQVPEADWSGAIFARAYGVKFAVRVSQADLFPAVIERLPPGTRLGSETADESFCCSVLVAEARPETDGLPTWQVFEGERQAVVAYSEAEMLEAFESEVRFEVARRSVHWTFVHAGVVGVNGRAVLIPGKSFSGKSRLVRALVQAGAEYYSDECAVLDSHGRVHPFAQPIMTRVASGGRQRTRVEDLGGTVGRRPLPVGLVVATDYKAGAMFNPVPVSPGQALLTLLSNSVRAQTAPKRVMRVLSTVAERAVALEGVRGDAEATAADLLKRAATAQPTDLRSIA